MADSCATGRRAAVSNSFASAEEHLRRVTGQPCAASSYAGVAPSTTAHTLLPSSGICSKPRSTLSASTKNRPRPPSATGLVVAEGERSVHPVMDRASVVERRPRLMDREHVRGRVQRNATSKCILMWFSPSLRGPPDTGTGPQHVDRALVLLAASCRLRFGELTELRRTDVDVPAKLLRVQRGSPERTERSTSTTPTALQGDGRYRSRPT